MLGLGATAVGAGVAIPVAELETSGLSRQAQEDGNYAAGPHGRQVVLWSVDTDQRIAALTFDDGPTPVFTPRALDITAAAGIPATFFMIGRLVADHPALATTVLEAGHEVANHSWSHVSAATVSDRHNM